MSPEVSPVTVSLRLFGDRSCLSSHNLPLGHPRYPSSFLLIYASGRPKCAMRNREQIERSGSPSKVRVATMTDAVPPFPGTGSCTLSDPHHHAGRPLPRFVFACLIVTLGTSFSSTRSPVRENIFDFSERSAGTPISGSCPPIPIPSYRRSEGDRRNGCRVTAHGAEGRRRH
jgi:hypothetical protein